MNKKGIFDFYILLFVGLFVAFLLILMNVLAGTFMNETVNTPKGFQVYYTKELTKFLRTPVSQVVNEPSELSMWEYIVVHYDDIKQFYADQKGMWQVSTKPLDISLDEIKENNLPYFNIYTFSYKYMKSFCGLYDELHQNDHSLKCYIEIRRGEGKDVIRFPQFFLENIAGKVNYDTILITKTELQGPDGTPYEVMLRYLR